MKPKQVIENLEQMKDHLETYNQQALVPYSQKYIQALDIAIESLEREEIKDPEDLYLGIDIAIKILEKQRDKVEPYERKENNK